MWSDLWVIHGVILGSRNSVMFLNSIYCKPMGNKKESKREERGEWPNECRFRRREEERF